MLLVRGRLRCRTSAFRSRVCARRLVWRRRIAWPRLICLRLPLPEFFLRAASTYAPVDLPEAIASLRLICRRLLEKAEFVCAGPP